MERAFELTSGAREKLRTHSWPGNVRELRSVIERAAAMCEPDAPIAADDLGVEWIQVQGSLEEHLEAEERRSLLAILESVDWNQSKAARELKIKRTTLRGKLTRLGVEIPRKKK
jgi:transcriptional regulator of acetoin/glycerol metabolism